MDKTLSRLQLANEIVHGVLEFVEGKAPAPDALLRYCEANRITADEWLKRFKAAHFLAPERDCNPIIWLEIERQGLGKRN